MNEQLCLNVAAGDLRRAWEVAGKLQWALMEGESLNGSSVKHVRAVFKNLV